MTYNRQLLFRIRALLILFIIGLIFSFQMILFVEPEIVWISKTFGTESTLGQFLPAVAQWVEVLELSITDTYAKYPAIAYCMDYLALSQLVIALFIAGAVKDPVKNIWIINAALLSCIIMLPFAYLSGCIRGIPTFLTTVDASFAILGIIPLLIAKYYIKAIVDSK